MKSSQIYDGLLGGGPGHEENTQHWDGIKFHQHLSKMTWEEIVTILTLEQK